MQLPIRLREIIEDELSGVKPEALAQAAAELSARYRAGDQHRRPPISATAHAQAYLATRLPATYTAVHFVLSEIKRRLPDETITSLLDLGAGPGTAMWAAAQVFEELVTVTLMEGDRQMISIGQRLALAASDEAIRPARWLVGDLKAEFAGEPHELVVMAYSLGEVPPAARPRLLERVWQLASKVAVIVEPGTMAGYNTIMQARDVFISAGAHVVAPCPHAAPCPLDGRDWCHFARRVERTAFHRRAKAATSPYEDEKFSYVVVAKAAPAAAVAARILRHPTIGKGHIRLELCAAEGLRQVTVTRSQKEAFRRARKAEWGDEWRQGEE